jgi:hypothetical protein
MTVTDAQLDSFRLERGLVRLRGGPFLNEVFQVTGRHDLNYGWFDLVGNIGVLMMVIAYLLLQLEKLSSSATSYLVLNAVGALMVIISLMFRFNLSAFFWRHFGF